MYRITHYLLEIQGNLYLNPATVSLQRGTFVCFLVPICRRDLYMHSFFLAANRLWKQLPLTQLQRLPGHSVLDQKHSFYLILSFI
ncbi:hypothetical protein DPMN_175463 [Dreissena polymorpha]|uniref:Uncharacterized protein n=1 Tax=Dreissena polymorpha TaxID=45954 RepID=A0A9D4E9E7_DREPO|nr:hypothetical protein DPMN_175463 [Dreissena polymorpha]